MATTAEPTNTSTTDDSNLSGISDAFGGLAEALIDDTDGTESLEADLADTGEAKPETPVVEAPVTEPQADGAEAKVEEPDPLKDAKALDYTVDGTAKSYDGIKILADKDGTIQGGIIAPESIKDVQYRLQRGEYLETQNKSLYGKVQEFERVAFKLPDGTEHRGLAAVQQYATENARLSAAVKVLAETIENPEKLIALAYAVQNNDQTEMQRLTREIGLVAKEASWSAREKWGQIQQQATQQDTQAQDVQRQTQDAITNSVSQWSSRYPALTKEDIAEVTQHLTELGSALVHPATPEQAQQAGVRPGDLVIHHDIVDRHLSARATLAARIAKATTEAQKAATENAQKLAAAARGKPGKKGAPSTKTPKPAEPEGETWAQQKARLQRGDFGPDED